MYGLATLNSTSQGQAAICLLSACINLWRPALLLCLNGQTHRHPGIWPATTASLSSSMLRVVLLLSAGGPQHNWDHRALSAYPDGQPGV